MLNERQQLTIQHLKDKGITEPMEIIKFCIEKLNLPRRKHGTRFSHLKGRKDRKHSTAYYQEIINYLAQQNLRDKTA